MPELATDSRRGSQPYIPGVASKRNGGKVWPLAAALQDQLCPPNSRTLTERRKKKVWEEFPSSSSSSWLGWGAVVSNFSSRPCLCVCVRWRRCHRYSSITSKLAIPFSAKFCAQIPPYPSLLARLLQSSGYILEGSGILYNSSSSSAQCQ